MKTCKRLLALLAVFSLTLAMMPVLQINAAEEEMFDLSWADPENEEMTVLEADELTDLEKEALVQIPAIKASEALGEYFSSIGYAADEIPECYGGAYINDNQQLVIKITSGNPDICKGIRDAMPFDASYTIEETDISLIELMSIQEEAGSFYRSIISTSGISQKDSIVNIDIPSEYAQVVSQTSLTQFKSNITSHIHLRVTDGRSIPTASLIGGNALYGYDDKKNWQVKGTIGFCGNFIKNNQYYSCVLTAGHLADEELYYGINNEADNVGNSIVQYENGEYGDYALIPIGENSTTNLVRLSNTTTGKITSAEYSNVYGDFEGRYVYKYGDKTGLTSGQIKDFNVSCTHDLDITIKGLTSIQNNTITVIDYGDSGGPVWYIMNDGTRQLYGNVSGKNTSNTHIGYFSRLYYPRYNSFYLPKLN